jgi:integrase
MSGEGSIFRRASDGAWIAQVSIGPRGNRRYVSRSAKTKAEARAKLDELRVEGARPTAKTATGAYLERWVNDVRDIRPTTRDGYRAVVTYHLGPTIGAIPLDELTPLDVERALRHLEQRKSKKTVRNAHAVLRRALGQAYRAGMLPRNVADRDFVDAPKVPAYEPDALTEDETRRLIAACEGDRLEGLYVLAVGTGLRQGELLGLAWEDVTADAVQVHKELVYRDGKYKREDPKTDRSKRRVPLPPALAAVVARHRERVKADGFLPTSTGPVFVNTKGGAMSGSWVTHHFYALCDKAGITRRPFKILRATYGSRLYDAGVPDVEIAALMGHTRTHTTKRHYIARGTAAQVKAVEVIESLVSQSRNQSQAVGEVRAGGA